MTKKKIRKIAWLFYCRKYEPDVPEMFGDVLESLKKKDFELKIIDVEKEPMLASDKNVIATPILILKIYDEEKRFVGIMPSDVLNHIG